jgi:hypothetical protein
MTTSRVPGTSTKRKPVTDMTTAELEEFVATGEGGAELEQTESITFNTKYCSDPRPASGNGSEGSGG